MAIRTVVQSRAAESKARAADAKTKAAGTPAPASTDVTVEVEKATSALTVRDASGSVLMYAPVTTGSEHDPLPIGTWKVTAVAPNPAFQLQP